jgi:hypothetical protein
MISSGSGVSVADTRRLDETARIILDFAGSTNGRILDVGCGMGGLLDSLAGLGCTDLTGLDPAAACANEVSRRGYVGIAASIGDDIQHHGTFDGIVLSHVLEHVLDLQATLKWLSSILRPDGWLFVEVPDANRYLDCLIAPWQDFNLEHINHFSLGSLRNVLRVNGWQVCHEGKRTLDLGSGLGYPAVYAFARYEVQCPLEADHSTHSCLLSYEAESSARMAEIEQILQRRVAAGPIVVWGAGQLTMRLLAGGVLTQAQIHAVVDANAVHHGKVLRGVTVKSPQEFVRSGLVDAPVIIGSLVNFESIERSIRALGLPNQVVGLSKREPA